MDVLNKNDYKLFKSLVKLKQKDLMKVVGRYLNKKYKNVIRNEKYIYVEGDIPIALVAHMDTVFDEPPKNIYYDEKQGVIWSSEGLGADDRAGVFAILKIIQSGLKPTVILTTDEEVGCLGADEFVKDYPTPPEDLKYIIQLDRRGTNDCVFYDCDNAEFVKYVESFGFIESYGSFSDISEICPAWGVAGTNLSIGYLDEHSYVETLHVRPMLSTIEKVKIMLKEEDIPFFEYIPDLRWSYPESYLKKNLYFGYSPYAYNLLDEDDYITKCDGCKQIFSETEMIPVKIKSKTEYYCPDCCVDSIEWCEVCGEPFKKDKTGKKLCGGKVCNTEKSKKNSTK